MKTEIVSLDEFLIFINSSYAKIDDYKNKEEVVEVVKSILDKYKSKLRLRGFYKIKVFLDERVGLFLEGVKLDSLERSSQIDLRIIVYFDEDIYFRTDDYFAIEKCRNVRYFDNNYYCLAGDIEDINSVLEYGEFVYGDYILDIIDKSCLV